MWLINLTGLTLIGAVIWWFWLYRPPAAVASSDHLITVTVADGIYQPERITVPTGQTTILRFIRTDPAPCAETVTFPTLDTSATLSLERPTDVTLPPLSPGEYPFTCQMQMYRGLLRVVPAEHRPSDNNHSPRCHS